MRKIVSWGRRGARRATLAAAFTVLALTGSARGAEAQISIVVGNGSSQSASQEELLQMFAGAVTAWSDGSAVQIVDQPNSPVGADFYQNGIGRTPAQVRKAFTALLLSGQAQKPQVVGSDAEVKAFLASNPGAVGYIATASLDGTVRELARIGG